jgi:hypothetical protein
MPARRTILPQAPLATATDGATNPVMCQTAPTSRLGKGLEALEALPLVVLRPALDVESIQGAGPGFRPS